MIIAAYAGCGKTTFAQKHPDVCVEVASMPYARILPIVKEETNRNFEQEKAAEYHVDNPIYPFNMIADILELEKKYKYVIIPSVQQAIDILVKDYKRSVILCYPEDGSEDEYRKRYEKRGNTELFCQIFADGMQDFLEQLKSNVEAYHFVLRSGEFIEDKFYEFEDICKELPVSTLNVQDLESLKTFVDERKTNVWLSMDIFMERVLYQVTDIDDAEERQFIYDFARKMYETDCMGSVHAYNFDVRELGNPNYKVVDKTELLQILERQTEKHERYFGRR